MIGYLLQRARLRSLEYWWRFTVVMTLWHWWYTVTCPLIGHDEQYRTGGMHVCHRCLRWIKPESNIGG